MPECLLTSLPGKLSEKQLASLRRVYKEWRQAITTRCTVRLNWCLSAKQLVNRLAVFKCVTVVNFYDVRFAQADILPLLQQPCLSELGLWSCELIAGCKLHRSDPKSGGHKCPDCCSAAETLQQASASATQLSQLTCFAYVSGHRLP